MSLRNSCFTINNYTPEDTTWCETVVCKYIIYGQEVGENGTPHYQGYIEFNGSKRFSTLKGECPRGHFEARRGSQKQAVDYCKKDNNFKERGTPSKQGTRSDLSDVCTDILEGVPMNEIAAAHPATFVQYHRGFERLQQTQLKPRTEKPTVIWLWGETGVGKSREACQGDHYIKDNSKWWDGYTQQKRIVIDDFDSYQWNFRDLLRVLDRYTYQGQTKGGYVHINSPEIYITSELPPQQLYHDNAASKMLSQILRRIDVITELKLPVADVAEVAW